MWIAQGRLEDARRVLATRTSAPLRLTRRPQTPPAPLLLPVALGPNWGFHTVGSAQRLMTAGVVGAAAGGLR